MTLSFRKRVCNLWMIKLSFVIILEYQVKNLYTEYDIHVAVIDMKFETGVWVLSILTVLFFGIGFFSFRNQRDRTTQNKDFVLEELVKDLNAYVHHLHATFPHDPRIQRLEKVVENTQFKGLSRRDKDVGYSIDKGDVLAVCTEDGPTNEAVFVLLHELAHVATNEWGHNEVFWSNFSFLIDQAEKFGWYTPVDYRTSPGSICGTTIETVPDDFVS